MSSIDILESLMTGELEVKEVLDALMQFDGAQKQVVAARILGVDPSFVIQEMFMGYKQRKQRRQLYSSDNKIPTTLIRMYYELGDRIPFESLKNAFVSRYINNESKLEGVHSQEEIAGFRAMYEYIHSDDIDYMFDIFTLNELHRKLYSKAPYPEFGGSFRRENVYLPGTGTEIAEWSMIRPLMLELDDTVQSLYARARVIKDSCDADELLRYLDECVILGCQMIKIHPFMDGNGRSIRGFINKLLEDAGLPPVYIKAQERTEYHRALNKGNNEGDYTDIKNFYRYKVCDSIIELDINERLKRENYAPSMTYENRTLVKQKNDDLKKNRDAQ